MQLKYAKTPRWSDEAQTRIDLVICWEDWPQELPFTASADDSEDHGRKIYQQAVEGLYGEIAPFVSPEPLSAEDMAIQVRQNRNALIATTDWTQAGDTPESTRAKWSDYRQALRDVPQQADFPFGVVWPSKPA